MALTLAQAQLATQNKLHRGIIEQYRKTSALLDELSFMDVDGDALKLLRENTSATGTAGFQSERAVITGDEAEWESAYFYLYFLTGQADVPNKYRAHMGNFNDLLKAQVKIKAKKMAVAFEDQAFYGDKDTSDGMDGLHQLALDESRVTHLGTNATPAGLTMKTLNTAIDSIEGGDPSAMFMSKTMRMMLSMYLQTTGQVTNIQRKNWGDYVPSYRNIPIFTSDAILNTELSHSSTGFSAKTGGSSSSIHIVRFGEGDGLVGIQSGGIKTEYFERLEDYDFTRVRTLWYVGLALYDPYALAVIDNIAPSTTVTSGL